MKNETEEQLLEVLIDIRNLLRISARESIKEALENALPDAKSRRAYQMLDGSPTVQQVRVACKMSPNAVVALANRCTALGLMEITSENKKVRLFDLDLFDLLEAELPSKSGAKS